MSLRLDEVADMPIPLVERNPTKAEVEQFRLILSTYQDGSGQQALKGGFTLPGWRDFERTIALVYGGEAQESKYIFDVLVPSEGQRHVGISCKMRRTLDDTKRTGRVTLELSNSSGSFWDRLGLKGINQQNYKEYPLEVAKILLATEDEWHRKVGVESGGNVDLSHSFYLALSWNKKGEYQLFKFPLALPEPTELNWDFPVRYEKGEKKFSRRLRGQDSHGTLFEWYGESGGQLKYYPFTSHALWTSEIFRLQELPIDWYQKHGIETKARDYFPDFWKGLEL
jgi:hypothetical protein